MKGLICRATIWKHVRGAISGAPVVSDMCECKVELSPDSTGLCRDEAGDLGDTWSGRGDQVFSRPLERGVLVFFISKVAVCPTAVFFGARGLQSGTSFVHTIAETRQDQRRLFWAQHFPQKHLDSGSLNPMGHFQGDSSLNVGRHMFVLTLCYCGSSQEDEAAARGSWTQQGARREGKRSSRVESLCRVLEARVA